MKTIDDERIEIEWDNFIDILTEETTDGHDGASDEFLLGIIQEKIKRSFPGYKYEVKNTLRSSSDLMKAIKRNEEGLHCRFCGERWFKNVSVCTLYETSPTKGIVCDSCLHHLQSYIDVERAGSI